MTPDINWSLSGAVGATPVYPGRLTAFRERSGRQAFPPVIALRLSVAQNLVPTLLGNDRYISIGHFPGHFRPFTSVCHSDILRYRNDRNTQSVTSRAGRGKPRISRTFHRLPRTVGSASVPTGDRAALVGSAKSLLFRH